MGVLVPVGIPCRPMGLLASLSQHSVDSLAHRASPRAGVSAHSADRNVSWLTRLRCPMRQPLHLTGMRELTNIIMATSTTVIRHETSHIRRSHVLCGATLDPSQHTVPWQAAWFLGAAHACAAFCNRHVRQDLAWLYSLKTAPH